MLVFREVNSCSRYLREAIESMTINGIGIFTYIDPIKNLPIINPGQFTTHWSYGYEWLSNTFQASAMNHGSLSDALLSNRFLSMLLVTCKSG